MFKLWCERGTRLVSHICTLRKSALLIRRVPPSNRLHSSANYVSYLTAYDIAKSKLLR